MSIQFQIQDPSLESQWRAIILFGKNTATYKFAFARSLLKFVELGQTSVGLNDLAVPFSEAIVEHLRENDKQGNFESSTFLDRCRQYLKGEITKPQLHSITEQLGFKNVVDAFQIVNKDPVPRLFYEKDYQGKSKKIILTDNLLSLKDSFHFRNFDQEVEARWSLVETAWNLGINPNILEVKHDIDRSLLFVQHNAMRRINITSVRDALNGYQKGKCFYSFKDISIKSSDYNLCEVDHFLPHINKMDHLRQGADLNGVWNLVLADGSINAVKSSRVPEKRYLQRLYNRNEFYIESKHPLSETIVNQTGRTSMERRQFLQNHYNLAYSLAIHTWKPKIELPGTF